MLARRMSIGDKVRSWIEFSAATVPLYQCSDCGKPAHVEDGECPECGGEIEHNHVAPYVTNWY